VYLACPLKIRPSSTYTQIGNLTWAIKSFSIDKHPQLTADEDFNEVHTVHHFTRIESERKVTKVGISQKQV